MSRLRRSRATLTVLAVLGALTLSGCDGGDPAPVDPMVDNPAAGPADTMASDGTVWVANEGDDSISILDAETGDLISTLRSLASPHNVQASPDHETVWVTTTGGVVAIDAETLAATHVAPAGKHPAHVVGDEDGNVYVTAYGDGAIFAFDDTLAGGHKIRLGGGPHGMRVSEDGSIGVVANTAADSLDVIDLRAGVKTAAILIGGEPIQVAITPDGKTAYVSVTQGHRVLRLSLPQHRVTGETVVGAAPAQIWLTDSGLLLSANQGTEARPGRTVSIIDAKSMTVRHTVRVGKGPHGLTMNAEGTLAYVTNSFDGTVSVIDVEEGNVKETVKVGESPNGITFTQASPVGTTPVHARLQVPAAYAGAQQDDDHDDHDHMDMESSEGAHEHH